jgi:hypothetical protein
MAMPLLASLDDPRAGDCARGRYGEIGCGVQFLSDTLNPGEPS